MIPVKGQQNDCSFNLFAGGSSNIFLVVEAPETDGKALA
jgi:hypothetical protein